mmetsp:Transcript_2595/g.4601  ORF Transcript_2595/g.4601 Transcript_2595/m.4601 type:complete len:440 (-) Transcript_2595:184-1503(-)|eukprot:CAMPEP_0201865766 /NCGR_PEP_ID=MMETSP0902-20130614/559_1 /ASSEMBLY_ACC=CAM_ASM_000551 /TAXON_ID=420261 /ORGANISM="Thalassiosira antarctica, Strain CCMP982" /LENGTH=439 /DNA_ID=CAMNT_0048390603 /DNA_START=134 /DNA_END=1453 /DNA_ORIENTATION=+
MAPTQILAGGSSMASTKRNNKADTNISSTNKIRLLYFFYRFSTGSLNPFMSIYMQHVGMDADQIGRLQAIRPVMTMLSAPMWGGLADRTGSKKLVLILAFFMSFLCRMSTSFLAGNIMTFACSLCASSVFYAPVSSLLDSIVVSSLEEHEKVNFGRLRLWGELGNGFGSTITMNLINHESGFEYMFLLHGVSSIVALIVMLYCVPPNQHTTKKIVASQMTHRTIDWKEGIRVVFGNVQILTIFGLVAITGYSTAILENFCYINIRQLYTKHGMMNVAGRDISLYRVCFSLGGTLTWWFSGSWSKRLGSEVVMFASVCCLPLCFFLYAGVGSELDGLTKVGFLTSEAIRSGIFAALWGNATIQVNKLSPDHVSSMMQAMLEATYRGIGHTTGSYSGGILCKRLDISAAFLVVGKGLASFLCMVGAIGFWTYPQRSSKKTE